MIEKIIEARNWLWDKYPLLAVILTLFWVIPLWMMWIVSIGSLLAAQQPLWALVVLFLPGSLLLGAAFWAYRRSNGRG